MSNEFTAVDFEKHLIRSTFHYLLDWSTATGVKTVLEAGTHPKMLIKKITVMNVGAACNAIEPVIEVMCGGAGNDVVASADMATILSATAVIGEAADLTIEDKYAILEADEALQIDVTTVDAGTDSRGLIFFDVELIA